MGRRPIGRFGSLLGGCQKRGLQANLQNEIVQEIETLLGRQAVQELDSKPWRRRPGGRLYGWPRERWNNG